MLGVAMETESTTERSSLRMSLAILILPSKPWRVYFRKNDFGGSQQYQARQSHFLYLDKEVVVSVGHSFYQLILMLRKN